MDYKQLGLIMLKVLDSDYENNNWKLSKEQVHHDFISSLINHGDFDQSLFNTWKDNLVEEYKDSVANVLISRPTKS